MLEKIKDKLLITSNKWYILIDHIYLGNIKFLRYLLFERKLEWITNDRIKIYILLKQIKGYSFKETVNKIFTKEYLKDPDYRDININ